MRFSFAQSTLQGALKQKDLSLKACLGLTLANLALVTKVITSEEHWVLIPQFDADHRLPLTSSKYSDPYLIDWASSVVNTLLCANSDSIHWKINQILAITTEDRGALKAKLHQEALRIKQDDVSTVFYPKKFTVNQQDHTIEIKGDHLSYFGKDTKPVSGEKTFLLTYDIFSRGLVLLKDIEEVKS